MAHSRAGMENVTMSLEYYFVPESKEVLTKITKAGQNNTSLNLKGFTPTKSVVILALEEIDSSLFSEIGI
jgi:hypothetical protein